MPKICIIGAGPSGLAALKTILATPKFKTGEWSVVAYEARDNVGGVWLPERPPYEDPPLTPLYDTLTTNLPHPIMGFTDFPFPPSTPVFPRASAVQTYLESYADSFGLRPYIRFNCRVTAVTRTTDARWSVTVAGHPEIYTHLIVANGHYRVPKFPTVPGLEMWRDRGKISHSAWYRRPDSFGAHKTYLVVGAGPSGTDITAELRLVPGLKIVQSVSTSPTKDEGNVHIRGRVVRFLDDLSSVEFADGVVEGGIHHCILATGYDLSFPFLPSSVIGDCSSEEALYNFRSHIYPLARHIFPLRPLRPTLSFLGLITKASPFPLAEAQAAAVVRSIVYPSSFEWDKELEETKARDAMLRQLHHGNATAVARSWHKFEDEEQFDYRDALNGPDYTGIANDNSRVGAHVPAWEKEMYAKKDVLRRVWRALEASGEADSWARGVGSGKSRKEGEMVEEAGSREWVELLYKLIAAGR